MKVGLLIILVTLSFNSLGNDKTHSIVYLNSYHEGYQWTDRCYEVFKDTLKTQADIHTFYMDSKRNQTDQYLKSITHKALRFIEDHKPDLIIAAEDNASAYIIEPFFKNHSTPVLFLGVNMDASIYSYPYQNATGIVEMDGITNLIQAVRNFSSLANVSMIFSSTHTSNKVYRHVKKENINDLTLVKVETAKQWFDAVSQANKLGHIIALDTITGILNLNHETALNFIKSNIDSLIITASSTSRKLAHIGYINLPKEQGIWTANQADAILKGKDIKDIPIRISSQYLMFINYELIEEMSLNIPNRLRQLPHADLKSIH